MDWEFISFNVVTFVTAVFVLDFGADKFIDHTVIIGRRLGISQTLIALLTAGAEYEELAVVIAAVIQHRTPLALGNVMGSTISNILGAFSLGLLFHSGPNHFDRTAKIYTTFLFLITTAFVGLSYFGVLNQVTGSILIATFVIYVVSIAYAIYRGIAISQEESDGDSDSDGADEVLNHGHENLAASETSPLLRNDPATHIAAKRRPRVRSLFYHACQLFIGLASLSISGYLLSHSATAIAASLNLSGTVMGITILSFATTLPEKLLAVISGSRGQRGILVASTAGSNIFLLTLCMGIVAVTGLPENHADSFVIFELGITWVSSALLLLIVMLSLGRWAGITLIGLYVAFLVLEFTVYKR